MARVLQQARGHSALYTTRVVHGFELVYRVGAQSQLQLYIPAGGGLRQLLIEELHNSSYAAHLGARKTVAALKQRVFWPHMHRDV